ncbi:MAG: TonB-dependent receptor [Pseudomonadales bacterium]|nr:TonB-dependent receptor [Pseudomonadales bacterium]MBO6564041.1 TonB-dependent receptor [Pseudomonadales bacterium]MBO6597438.1 TonB-dependent receptor [Pseudomonadales bacterium]MBO6824172.1 TonB-dependent receptor [Pseudomonadales bacterium]
MKLKATTLFLTAALCSAVQAEETIEEVVVTATKRASTIQEVPFSINAQSQEDIQRSGATNIEELSRNVAGLIVQNLGPGQSQVAIRGVSAGQIIRDQPGVKEQVGVYLDESVISLSLFTPDLDLYDLNRVETLRGPQGTLFGSGSVGGTIRYITNQPEIGVSSGSMEFDVNTVTDGNEGGHVKGMVNVPLTDNTALRLVGYSTEYAGFIDALGENGDIDKDVNSGNRSGIRAALRWEASDNVVITPRVVFQQVEADGFNRQEVFNLYANPYTTTRPAIQLDEREQYLLQPERFEDDTTLVDLTIEVGFDSFDFVSVSSFLDRDILVSRDASALTGSVSVDLGYPDDAVLLPSNLRDTTQLEQFTQEIRISSNSDSRLQWLVGAFYSDVERSYAQRLPTPGYDFYTDLILGGGTSDAVRNGFPELNSPFNSNLPYDIEQLAVFGELTYDVSDKLSLTLGGRWYDFEEERTITTGGLFAAGDSGVVDKTDSDGFNPRVLAAFELNENVTLNAQASQGFRLGGVNDPLNTGLCSAGDLATFGGFQAYDDETMWNYETGFKADWDNGVTLNFAVFHSEIEDLQVTLDAGSCSSRISFNVEEAHTTGMEFELAANPTDNLVLTLAGSILESEFDDTVIADTGGVLGGVEDGNRLASVPELQLAASATYNFSTELFGGSDGYFSATVHHVGDRFTQPSDQVNGAGVFSSGLPFGGATGAEQTVLDLELDPYTLVNLRLGIVKDDWETAIYVNNITDENADLSFDRERGGRARLAFRTNTPRTVGILFRKYFD